MQTVIIYFWPNSEFQELEENPFVPREVILDTSTPNSPAQTPPLVPPEYQYSTLGPPCLTPEADESSDETAVGENSRALHNSSDIRAKTVEVIWRVQHQINLDQIAFDNLTY